MGKANKMGAVYRMKNNVRPRATSTPGFGSHLIEAPSPTYPLYSSTAYPPCLWLCAFVFCEPKAQSTFSRLGRLNKEDMMKKIHNLKLFELVAFLAFALIFVGIDVVEGQTQDRPALEDYTIMPIFPALSDPQISPDGTKVLFTYTTANVNEDRYDRHIWLLPLDEKNPKQFTYGNGNDSHPRWSPDGKTILFLSDRLSEENKPGMQIFVIPADGGEARSLTSVEEGVKSPTWSPDGKNILFLSNVFKGERAKGSDIMIIRRMPYRNTSGEYIYDEWTHLFSVPSKGGEVKQLTDGEFNTNKAVWFPDGSRVAFLSRGRIYTISSKGGDPELLWKGKGSIGALGLSPDGKYFAYGASERVRADPAPPFFRNSDIHVLPVKGGEPENLTADFDRDVSRSPLIWSPDSKYIYFWTDDHGSRHLYRASLNRQVERVTEGNISVGGLSLDRTGSVIVFNASDAMTPTELWIKDEKGARRLTEMNKELLSKLKLSKPEEFWVTASDGVKVQGWIVKPHELKEKERYPTVFLLHGGLYRGSYGFRPMRQAQVLADHGFAVVYMNFRGSGGYGEAFAGEVLFSPSADGSGNWGERDYQDIMETVDYVINTYPFIDPERLGVTGGSYGGFMTSWIVGQTDRFKAAVTSASRNNHYSSMLTSDSYGTRPEISERKAPWDNLQRIMEKSSITYVKNVTTPLLIIHSELDFVTSIEQAEQLFTALWELKKVVEFIRIPNEPHGVRGPKHRVEREQHTVRWFDTYLR